MADLQEFKCPGCGGSIEFNSETQKMQCPYCDTEFDVEALKGYEDEKTPASFKKTEKPADTSEKLAAHRVGRGSSPVTKEGGFFVSNGYEDEKTPASFKRTEKPADTREKLAAHRVGRGSSPVECIDYYLPLCYNGLY